MGAGNPYESCQPTILLQKHQPGPNVSRHEPRASSWFVRARRRIPSAATVCGISLQPAAPLHGLPISTTAAPTMIRKTAPSNARGSTAKEDRRSSERRAHVGLLERHVDLPRAHGARTSAEVLRAHECRRVGAGRITLMRKRIAWRKRAAVDISDAPAVVAPGDHDGDASAIVGAVRLCVSCVGAIRAGTAACFGCARVSTGAAGACVAGAGDATASGVGGVVGAR